MAKDSRKRQKKLEKRKAKDKARKKAIAEREPRNAATGIQRAAAAPILHCCTTHRLFEQGMSQVLVSRQLPDGNVAFVAFLVDMYCLGVKDVMLGVAPRNEYESRIHEKMRQQDELVDLEPAAARKLVEGAVDYAREAGIAPHRDYRKGQPIFGDIDAGECTEEFTYGKDGKPYFFAGPYDSRSRCREILNILTSRLGADGFHYTIPFEDLAEELPGPEPLTLEVEE